VALDQAARVPSFPPPEASNGPAWFYHTAAAMAKAALDNTTPTAEVYADYCLICAHFHLFPDFVAYFAADTVARELSLRGIQELNDDDDEAWTFLFDPSPGMFADPGIQELYSRFGPSTMPEGLVTAAMTFLDRCVELAVVAAEPSPFPSASPPPGHSPVVVPRSPLPRSPRPPALAGIAPPATPPPSPTGRAAAGASPQPPADTTGGSGSNSSSSESSSSEGSGQQLP